MADVVEEIDVSSVDTNILKFLCEEFLHWYNIQGSLDDVGAECKAVDNGVNLAIIQLKGILDNIKYANPVLLLDNDEDAVFNLEIVKGWVYIMEKDEDGYYIGKAEDISIEALKDLVKRLNFVNYMGNESYQTLVKMADKLQKSSENPFKGLRLDEMVKLLESGEEND